MLGNITEKGNSKIKLLLAAPEYLLVLAVLFYWMSSAVVFNPVAIILFSILILQIIFKNPIVGLIIPIMLIIICLYMLLALFSEFNEFPVFDADAKQLLFVGLTYFLSTIIVSGIMLFKYLKKFSSNIVSPSGL